MTNELKNVVEILEKLNNESPTQLLKVQEINEAHEAINEYQKDLKKLQNTIVYLKKANMAPNQKVVFAIAEFNEHLVRIVNDIKDIDNLLTLFAQRYAKTH